MFGKTSLTLYVIINFMDGKSNKPVATLYRQLNFVEPYHQHVVLPRRVADAGTATCSDLQRCLGRLPARQCSSALRL